MDDMLSLDEFIALPTTVDFVAVNSRRFRRYADERPFIRIGTVLPDANFVIAYTDQEYIPQIFGETESNFITSFPAVFSLLDTQANEASGITPLQQNPHLDLRGQGVLLGFIDTGIDYTKDAFRYADGTSKIKYLWDQTVPGNPPEDMRFGSVYTQEQINRALRSPDPREIVPSLDTHGHGTFLASVAGGHENNEYMGVAPDSEIVFVKLKRARNYYYERFTLPRDNPYLYQSTDFMLGIKFIIDHTIEFNRPVAICVGMGTNFGPHNGTLVSEQYISAVSRRLGVAIVTAAGNESNTRRHTTGTIRKTGDTETISVNVGQRVSSFSTYIWSAPYNTMSVSVQSPTGQVIPRKPFIPGFTSADTLIFERSTVKIYYYPENIHYIGVTITDPTPGLWNINLYGDYIIDGRYNAWMSLLCDNVAFLRPDPNFTVVSPATALRTITAGAYDSRNGSLYVASSWGPTAALRMSPDFVAPGVDVRGVFPTGYGTMTGTSVAAAMSAGAAALLLQWGIIRGNEVSMNGDRVRTLLISGCRRNSDTVYPNYQTGYGQLDLFNTFNRMRVT